VRSGAVDVIVVDSVAALTPQAEFEGDMGDAHVGLLARLMSQALRKLTATIGKSRTILVFINQTRMKIGVMYGNPETTTGGNALKFYASVRLEVRTAETIDGGKDEDAVGNWVRVKVVKNKVAPPFRKVELEIIFGKGVSALGSIIDAAVKHEIIDKKGAWYSFGEEKIGQGRDNVKIFLEERPELTAEIEAKLRKIMFPHLDATAGGKAPAEKPAAPIPAAGKSAAAGAPTVDAPAAEAAVVPATEAANVAETEPVYGKDEAPEFAAGELPYDEPVTVIGVRPGEAPRRAGPGRPPKAAPAAAPTPPPAARPGPGRPRKNP
jgi:recombination protein RecA